MLVQLQPDRLFDGGIIVGLAEQVMHSSCKRVYVGADPTAGSFSSTDPKPDQRAGTVSKTDRAMGIAWGASPLRVRQFWGWRVSK